MFLGETATWGSLFAIAISVVGIMLIPVARSTVSWTGLVTSVFRRTALIGLASGVFFGIAAVAYRVASLSLGGPNFIMQAVFTLAFVIVFQTAIMPLWMLARDRSEIGRIVQAWKPALIVGLAGVSASLGWFMAMTLQQAAYVKVVAQVEIIFTCASSVFIFRETVNRLEMVGTALIVAGVIALVAFA